MKFKITATLIYISFKCTFVTLKLQVLIRNNSYVNEQELLDYQTMQESRVQLSIINKQNVPLTIGVQSQCIFDITLKGR